MVSQAEMMRARFGVDIVELEGLPFLDISERAFVDLIAKEARYGRGGWVVTPNTDILRQAHDDLKVRELLQTADALVADGMPLPAPKASEASVPGSGTAPMVVAVFGVVS